MKRILSIIAVVAITGFVAVAANTSEAGPSNKGYHASVRVNAHSRGYRNWRSYCYYAPYRCYLYYDAATQQWYFYSSRLNQFLPFSMIATNAPLTNGAAYLPQGGIPGTPGLNTTGNPALPPGATPLPPQGGAPTVN